MRRTRPFLLASLVLAAPLPVPGQACAQVTVDPNALNALGNPNLPAPPPAKAAAPQHHGSHHNRYHHRHPAAGAAHTGKNAGTVPTPEKAAPENAVPAKTTSGAKPVPALPPAGANTENKSGLGSSFKTVPVLPGAIPAAPAPPKITVNPPPKKEPAKGEVAPSAPAPAPAPAAPMPSLPSTTLPAAPPAELFPGAPQPAKPEPAAPEPAAPEPAAPEPAAHPSPVVKPPVAPAPAAPPPLKSPAAVQASLPPGADQLTLPYSGQETDASGAIPALIRDFVARHGTTVLYIVRAYASQPKGDDDPSSPRRIALMRAQGVQAALTAAGVDPLDIRLLALGNAGGAPADRVDLIAMPPAPGHTTPSSSP